MSNNNQTLHVDMETCSSLDLKEVGADIYSRSPDLIVTVIAWAFDDGPVKSAALPRTLPDEIYDHLIAGGRFKAWNAAFEKAILDHHYSLINLDPGQASCTMQRAVHAGLPRALGDAGPALGLSVVKDASAQRLMLQMAKPRSQTSYWHQVQAKLDALEAYCERDVEAERAIDKLIPKLPAYEQAVLDLDTRANERGIAIDVDLVKRLKTLATTETDRLAAEATQITQGRVTNPASQTQRSIEWLASQGETLPNLSKREVAETLILGGLLDPKVERFLEIRREIAKTSVKKLDKMLVCSSFDGRVRGQLAYYGAHTGRWAGRLIQPQNLPRPTLSDVEAFIADTQAGESLDWLTAMHGSVLDAIASSLRGCLVPGANKKLLAFDLSQIEARVVAWLAGQRDVLDACERGEDIYLHAMKQVGLQNRSQGKVARLGLGYQMGAGRLIDYAKTYGVKLTAADAEVMVKAFRLANPQIVKLWWDCDRAVKRALERFAFHPLRPVQVKINAHLSVQVGFATSGHVVMLARLPSGRKLFYRNPRLEQGEITFDGVNPITHQWGPLRTYGGRLTENLTQAVARDVIVEAALRVDAIRDVDLVLSVHDELVLEVPARDAPALAVQAKQEIEQRPKWAQDLPVACEGGVRSRYGK